MSDFFAKTARDMLKKARREFTAMQSDLTPDNIGDFFTTIAHVMDYVKVELKIPPNTRKASLPVAVQQMYDDPDMTIARELNNLHKHAKLNPSRCSSGSPTYSTHADTAFTEPEQRYTAAHDGTNIAFETVGTRLIAKLEKFLDDLG